MKAAVYDGTPDIKYVEHPAVQIGPKDVLLKIHACGICATDLRILNSGHRRIPDGVNRVLGHELSGEVVAVGKELSSPRLGSRVAVSPNFGCGVCDNCIQGYTNLCQDYLGLGTAIDGGFAEYMRIPEQGVLQGNIVELPDDMSYQEAAVLEPLSCAYRGMMACQPQPGENVLVIGAGPIGIMHMRIAEMLGAGKVIVSEVNPKRIEELKSMGAEHVINPMEQNFVEGLDELTNGKGIDVGIVAVGSAAAQKQCLEVMAYHGRVNFFGGLPKNADITQISANLIHYRELWVTGTTGQTVKQFRTVADLVSAKKLQVSDLITHTFSLADISHAVDFARSQQGLKTLVLPSRAGS